jgi:hypothetical protein
VSTPSIVEDFDVVVDRVPRFAAHDPRVTINEFLLERAEKALDDRIVMALAFPTHAACDAAIFQHVLVFPARVLAAAIRVMK